MGYYAKVIIIPRGGDIYLIPSYGILCQGDYHTQAVIYILYLLMGYYAKVIIKPRGGGLYPIHIDLILCQGDYRLGIISHSKVYYV